MLPAIVYGTSEQKYYRLYNHKILLNLLTLDFCDQENVLEHLILNSVLAIIIITLLFMPCPPCIEIATKMSAHVSIVYS